MFYLMIFKKKQTIFGLVWFYGKSNIVGYLIPNSIFTYILNIWFVNTFCRYKQLTFLHKVKWFQEMLCITNNSVTYLFTHS